MPSDITSVERRALEDATLRSGARRVYVIEETMAAAIGAGLPVEETRASMVVDVGGGTTDVAILSLGGIVTSRTVRIGGDEIDDALVAHVKSEYSLLLGERSAEDLKIGAGSAFPLREELTERVRGRDLVTGLPKTVSIGSAEVRRAIETPLVQIVELVRTVLDVCPPELAGDVVDRGIALTGGGALIRGLDERLSHELGVPGARRRRPPARGRPRRRPVRRGVQHARARARRQPAPLTMHVRRTPSRPRPGRVTAGRGTSTRSRRLLTVALVRHRPRRGPRGVRRRRSRAGARAPPPPCSARSNDSLGPGDDEVSAARAEQTALATRLAAAQREVAALHGSAGILEAPALAGARLVPARVVAVGASGPAGPERVTIDAGSRDGVEVDRTVVAAEGLVGRVVSVAPWTSDVLLVGSPDLTVGVRVGPRGVLGEASGAAVAGGARPAPGPALLRPRRPGHRHRR